MSVSNDRAELLSAVDLRQLLEDLTGLDRRGPAYPCPNREHDQTGATPPVSISTNGGSYEVWHCHGCAAGGTAVDALMLAHGLSPADAFSELRRLSGREAPSRSAVPRDGSPTATEADASRYEESLTPSTIERLRELRGWSREAVRGLHLGFDRGRVTFPVRDATGRLVGILRYQPDPALRGEKPKMLADKDSSRQPFPRPEDVEGPTLYVVEGEPDAVVLYSLGLPAVGLPGTGKRDPAWWPRLAAGRERIVICADCDAQGRTSARETAAGLAEHCCEVALLDLEPSRNDGYDVSCLVLEALQESGDSGYRQARSLLEAAGSHAERIEPPPPHSAPGRVPNADRDQTASSSSSSSQFIEGTTFLPERMGEWLRTRFPTATGGRQLYAFREGIYKPAEDFLRYEITQMLGPRWKPRHADEVIAYLAQSSKALWQTPPRQQVAVSNGLLSLPGRALASASPGFLSPVRIAAAYEPGARCPTIERFLDQVFPNGAELLYEVIGHLIVPENHQRAFMFLGPGGNGKSTVLRLIRAFLGPENVSAVSLHALEENRFATADLYGKLANIYADLDARALNATGIFKSITGGDPIRAERKGRDAFSFVAYARLIFSANEPPPTSDSSHAFFDRWIIVPFQQRLRGSGQERQQDELLAELTDPGEFSGLLNHALDGLQRLRAAGQFTRSSATISASADFRAVADSVAGFLDEYYAIRPDARVPRADLWHAYRSWCDENNRRPLGAQRFHGRVRELVLDLDEVKVVGVRTYVGLELETQ